MSVEYCTVRVDAQTFEDVQQQPNRLQELMDAFYAASSDESRGKGYVDSRQVIRGAPLTVPPLVRILYFDEFTTSLLVDFRDENSAFFMALAGWGHAHILPGVRYGYGEVSYYFPDEVKKVALELNTYPQALLEERFWEGAENYRIASAGYLKDDQAILAHQRLFAEYLRKFFNEAAQEGEFVLLLTV